MKAESVQQIAVERIFYERIHKELGHYAAKIACKVLAGTLRTVYGLDSGFLVDAASTPSQTATDAERVKGSNSLSNNDLGSVQP